MLAEALRSGKCPPTLILNLNYNGISPRGMNALADALMSGKCPNDLTLIMAGNTLNEEEGILALAKASIDRNRPVSLTLKLGSSFQEKLEEAIKYLSNKAEI